MDVDEGAGDVAWRGAEEREAGDVDPRAYALALFG